MKEFQQQLTQMFELGTKFESYNLKIVLLLAVAFAVAGILGYFAWKLKVSPILGYLLTGYLIGPYSPGFVADMRISEQLAEVGVILMMFGVGLDFKLRDLIKVKNIAIPGALIQTLLSASLGVIVIYLFGWPLTVGITLGLSISVASTVVLARMLGEHHLLKTQEGHIAIGWLIVEDIFTVLILLVLPILSVVKEEGFSASELFTSFFVIVIKFVLLALTILLIGKKGLSYILSKVMGTRSHELFTLSILALVFLITIGTSFLFGVSIALGAFIAGMMIRQTKVHHKALAHSRPMKDAFIAIFFISVGMIFNPSIMIKSFPVFISILLIILIAKPAIAFLVSICLRYPFRAALTVAIALAQIGEFSFILSEESMRYGFMSDDGYDIVVACALISISINQLIFKILNNKQPA